MNRIFIILCFLVSMPVSLLAQEEWEKNSNVDKLIYDVVGNREIRLNQANRIFDPVPPQPVDRTTRNLSLSFNEIYYGAGDIGIQLRPRQIAAETEDYLYSSYVKAGFGNFLHPYLDAYLSNKRQKEFSFGTHLYYDRFFNGAVDKRNSGSGQWGLGLFGDAYGDKATIYSDLDFDRTISHFYGYPDTTDPIPDSEDILRSFNRINFKAGIKSSDANKDFQYDASAQLRHVSDNLTEKETQLGMNVRTSLEVIESIFVEVNGGLNHVNRTGVVDFDNPRTWVFVEGFGRWEKEKFMARGGVRIDYDPDTLAQAGGMKYYPMGEIQYQLTDEITGYAKLMGGIQMNTWNTMTQANPFIEEGADVFSTNQLYSLDLGVTGRLGTEFSYQAGIDVSGYSNAAFFVNDPADISRFTVEYDTGSVEIRDMYLGLNYAKDELYRASVRFDYFTYQMDALEAAFHRPEYSLDLSAGVNIGDKILLDFRTLILGGMTFLENDEVKSLDTIIDIGLETEYKFNAKFGAFIDLNNVLNQNYLFFNQYPVRGFRVLGGVVYRF